MERIFIPQGWVTGKKSTEEIWKYSARSKMTNNRLEDKLFLKNICYNAMPC